MTRTSAPKILSDDAFEERLATYRPKALPPEKWEAWADAIVLMVKAAEPSSTVDLTHLLGTGCAFLAWSTPIHGEADLPAQVEPDRITEYLKGLEQSGAATGTLKNRRSHLFRIQRGLAGLPPRKAHQHQRNPFAKPYSHEDVIALRAITAPSAAVQLLMSVADDGTLNSSDVLDKLREVTTDDVRAEFASVGLKFDRHRWRSTWASRLVSPDTDFVTLARQHGFTRNDCERYLQDHAATPGTVAQLRG